MTRVLVNHVMSNDVPSKIFSDILDYFKRHSRHFVHEASEKPISGALIRHYHRPNLETRLINPAVVTVHHDLAESDDSLAFHNYEEQYRQADLIVCLNRTQQAFLRERGMDRTVVVPHGFNDRFLRPVKRDFDGSRRLRLGIFSRRYPRKVKGEAYTYELAQQLDPDHFEFLLIGQDRKLDAVRLRSLGFDVRSFENMPYSLMCAAYEEIDLLLIASRHEGGPANVPEALATHTPMATTRIGMAADMVHDGVNGFFLSLDPEEDARVLEQFYAQPGSLARMFEGAQQAAVSASPWSTVVATHERLYGDLIADLVGVCRG